jgi:hypothetical protein
MESAALAPAPKSLEARKLQLLIRVAQTDDEELIRFWEEIIFDNEETEIKKVQTNGSVQTVSDKDEMLRPFGFAKDVITYVAPDFDDTPPGFEEYMQQQQ